MEKRNTPNSGNDKTDRMESRAAAPVEKTAREVNREISAELKRQKAADREKVIRRDVGTGINAMERAQRKHKGDIFAQLSSFFDNYVIKAGTGRKRVISARTSEIYKEDLFKMLEVLRELGRKPQNLSDIGQSHVIALIRYWGDKGYAPSTVQNFITVLRRFLTFIGKDKILPRGNDLTKWMKDHSIETNTRRSYIPTESKAWDEKGVDLFMVVSLIKEICPITAIQIEMQAAFGLRPKESIQINPRGADCGNFLRVVYGTKGGRPRDVQFDPDESVATWQRDVLERAKLRAMQNRKGTLSIDGLNIQESKRNFYYVCSKAGVTQKALGVTPHGLRHQYAARRYKQITGMNTPVSGMAPATINADTYQADLHARGEISEALGHFRPDITRAYVGSLPALAKNRKKNVGKWIALTEGDAAFQEALKEAGIEEAWLAGKAGQGVELNGHDSLRIIVRSKDRMPLSDNAEFQLNQKLSGLYIYKIDLSQHFAGGPPNDSLELHLHE